MALLVFAATAAPARLVASWPLDFTDRILTRARDVMMNVIMIMVTAGTMDMGFVGLVRAHGRGE